MAVGALHVDDARAWSRRTVRVLDVDPDLGAGLAPERLAVAAQLRAAVVRLPRGEWSAATLAPDGAPDVGLLVIEGVLARETLLEDTVSTELLGPGDFLRPWSGEEDTQLLRCNVRWQVLAETQLAVLGKTFASALGHLPEINAALTDRALGRAQRLATMQAIAHLNSVERRLWALLWHLAERWGRVTRAGVVLPLALSHRLLGELIGARRPTVTTALAALEREGKVQRREDATWLLIGEPPGTPAESVRRLVSHRRRLPSRPLSVVDGGQAGLL
jgi:CRP/FNR family transcriptional regulator, cyclic AMP receptor protein